MRSPLWCADPAFPALHLLVCSLRASAPWNWDPSAQRRGPASDLLLIYYSQA